jgi:uncharacterized protein (DUF3820 family)
MDYSEAATTRMPFGKFKGDTLLKIAGDERGIGYLEWLVDQDWFKGKLRRAVQAFLKGMDQHGPEEGC